MQSLKKRRKGNVSKEDMVYWHCKDDPIYVFPEMKLHGLVPNLHIHVSVNDIYTVFPRSVHLFCCSKISRIGLGTRSRIFISGNICFELSVKCLCSAVAGIMKLTEKTMRL